MAFFFLPLVLLAAVPGLSVSPLAPALSAQERVPAPPAKPVTPPTLKAALDNAAWEPSQRGPLLIVAPDVVVSKPLWSQHFEELLKKGANPAEMKLPSPVPASNGQYRVPEIAPFYGRRLVRLKGITVLAPETMIVLNDNPGKPNIFDGMRQDQKVQMFQATLSDAQWAILGSDRGIGTGDLNEDQRDLFLSLIPDPFTVMRGTAMAGGGMRFGGDGHPPTKLAGNERLGIRLRLNRSIQMGLLGQGGTQTSAYVNNRREGEESLSVNTWQTSRTENKVFGQTIRSSVPVRLKPQQIDFEASSLNAPIPLSGAKTVGDLVERVRTITRVEIFVDPRLAKQAVWLKTSDETSLRAGELLRALCWSMAGSVRYVEEGRIFLLTDDITGWGTRVARVRAWMSMAEAMRQMQVQNFTEQIRKRKPLQYLKFGEGDPLAVDAERMAEIEGKWTTPRGRYEGITVPLQRLSAEQQDLARSTAAAHNAQFGNGQRTPSEYNRPVNAENVRMSFRVRTSYIVPGVGEIEDNNGSWSVPEAMLPPIDQAAITAEILGAAKKTIQIPAKSPVGGILKASPKDAVRAKMVVRAAREHGFRQVWITVPSPKFPSKISASTEALPDFDTASRDGKALLAAAIEEGKADAKKPVAILASVSLLSASPGEPSAEPAAGRSVDFNLLGETSVQAARRLASAATFAGVGKYADFIWASAKEWLLPDAPGVAARVKRHILELAAVPGLAGIALKDTAAPGYETAGSGGHNYYGIGGSPSDADMGYVPTYRAAFLRRSGYDPVDLAPQYWADGLDLNHPLLGNSTPTYSPEGRPVEDERANVGSQWNNLRFTAATDLLKSIYAALDADKKLQKSASDTVRSVANVPAPLAGDFALYVRTPGDSYGSYVLMDKSDSLIQELQKRKANPGSPQIPFETLRAASSRCLFTFTWMNTDLFLPRSQSSPPRSPVEFRDQFALSFNQTLGYRKGNWDGYVFDLSQENLEDSLALLSAVTVEAAPRPAARTGRR